MTTVSETDRIVVITEGEFDAMAVHQGTWLPCVSLPNGANSLPLSLLKFFDRFERIYLWLDADEVGLNAAEINGWLRYGGGQPLWDELYAQFGLKGFPVGNTGVQMGGWFNREINALDDFKGLVMRMPGLGGEVLRGIGATVKALPGGEIFQALKTGAIDATEWVGPYNDLAFGLHQAAKYYYWPGWHEPGTALECMVNKDALAALPSDLQSIVAYACQAANDDMLSEFTARNNSALETLVKQHGVQLRRFPDELLAQVGAVASQVVADIAGKDPFSQKVYASFEAFRKGAVSYTKITEEAYTQARALTFG